jgi:hypothetical protein
MGTYVKNQCGQRDTRTGSKTGKTDEGEDDEDEDGADEGGKG